MGGSYLNRIFVLIILCFPLLLSLSSCFLDGKGRAPERSIRPGSPIGEAGPAGSWSADAFPGFACPADQISLRWNVGDPFCRPGTGPSCQLLTVTDNVGLLAPPFTSRDLSGNYDNGSISGLSSWSGQSPTFTFSVAHDDAGDPGWQDWFSQVVIVQGPPEAPITQDFDAYATTCDGRLGWRLDNYGLDMAHESFIDSTKGLGDCVRIASVCYMPEPDSDAQTPDAVVVSVVGDPRMRATTLGIGDCVLNLSLPPDLAYDVRPASAPIPTHEGMCDAEGLDTVGAEPPFIRLRFGLSCDTTLDECGN